MRDIVFTGIFFTILPFVFTRPHWGIYLWTWLAMMNPHRLCWGFAYDMPFAMITAIATLIAIWRDKDSLRMSWTRESVLLLVFVSWMFVTTVFALYPALAWEQWDKIWKIQLFVFMTILVIDSREKLHGLIWVITLSFALYGVKGGIFTIVNGGVYRVQGPTGSFIGGNNETALALCMTLPLLRYLQLQTKAWWIRLGLTVAMVLSGIAIIGTQSRGGLLGILATGAFLWLKSRNKLFTLVAIVAVAWAATTIMPQQWYDRMNTIQTYEQDRSAMGRISAWWTAFNLAKDRVTGGGFETFQWHVFQRYSPTPELVHDVHSVYFEVMGEHGFIGFGMFMLLALFAWNTGNRIRRLARPSSDMKWMSDLATAIQVSMVGYAAAGAFLGLAYFDLYYTLIAAMVICGVVQERLLAGKAVTREVSVSPSSSVRERALRSGAVRYRPNP